MKGVAGLGGKREGGDLMSTCWLRQVKSFGESKEEAGSCCCRECDHENSQSKAWVYDARIGSIAELNSIAGGVLVFHCPLTPHASARSARAIEDGDQYMRQAPPLWSVIIRWPWMAHTLRFQGSVVTGTRRGCGVTSWR